MKKYKLSKLIFICFLFLISCNTVTPEKYFNIAVLNTNVIQGFASKRMTMELESPSVKLSENSNEPVTMKRSEVINAKIEFTETNLDNLKDLKVTEDTKDMLEASKALYEYILPVYKTDYMQLAGLYDSGAPIDQIQSMTQAIHDKYFFRYDELHIKLIGYGKTYAQKHDIKVNWGGY